MTLALPPAPPGHLPGYFTIDDLDGVPLRVLHLPWSIPLDSALAFRLEELAWLARQRGWHLRVMRGVTELDVRDPDDDPAAVPGSSMAWELEKLDFATDLITDHLPRETGYGYVCDCGTWSQQHDGGGWSRHLAEVLDGAGRLTGARW